MLSDGPSLEGREMLAIPRPEVAEPAESLAEVGVAISMMTAVRYV